MGKDEEPPTSRVIPERRNCSRVPHMPNAAPKSNGRTPLNARQAAFCRFLAEGRSNRDAYLLAGYNTTPEAADANAARLLGNDRVSGMVKALQAQAAARTTVTIETLAQEFDENRAHALRVDQVGAAVQATAMKAKLFGFMVDRQQVQVEHTLRKPSADENAPAEMSLEDWQAKYGGSRVPASPSAAMAN